MRIYSWNVNGLRAVVRKGAFQTFIGEHRPDILGLQETKALQGQAEIDLPDYKEYWNSASKKGYSGTAIFSKIKVLNSFNNLPASIANKYKHLTDIKGDALDEGRIITAEYKDFYFITSYIPNSKDDLSRLRMRQKAWDPALLEYCTQLEKTKPVILCGDFNVAHTEYDLANPKANRRKHGFTDEERQGFDNFLAAGFIDTFRLFTKGNGYYTWWTHWANARARNVGWRIDYILVSKSLKSRVMSAKIHPDIMGSDHCPVSIELK